MNGFVFFVKINQNPGRSNGHVPTRKKTQFKKQKYRQMEISGSGFSVTPRPPSTKKPMSAYSIKFTNNFISKSARGTSTKMTNALSLNAQRFKFRRKRMENTRIM